MEETVGVLVTANGGKVTTMETLTEESVKLYPSDDSFYYHHSYDNDDDSNETDTDSNDDNLDNWTLGTIKNYKYLNHVSFFEKFIVGRICKNSSKSKVKKFKKLQI